MYFYCIGVVLSLTPRTIHKQLLSSSSRTSGAHAGQSARSNLQGLEAVPVPGDLSDPNLLTMDGSKEPL